jgi:HSP20 family molecular chaperone IbpA
MAKVPVQKKQEAEEQSDVERTEDRERFSPAVDIYENEKELVLTADMPGVAKDSLDIKVDEGVLTISGKVATPPSDAVPVYAEYRIGDYYRAFSLSDEIDVDEISAEMADGVLRLHLPKSAKTRSRRIQVKGA